MSWFCWTHTLYSCLSVYILDTLGLALDGTKNYVYWLIFGYTVLSFRAQIKPAADQSADGDQPYTDELLEVIIQDYHTPKNSEWLTEQEAREKNYIHVSVRKALANPVDDADYDYTDPSPFLDRLVPIPKWIQECNDHEFRYDLVKYALMLDKMSFTSLEKNIFYTCIKQTQIKNIVRC